MSKVIGNCANVVRTIVIKAIVKNDFFMISIISLKCKIFILEVQYESSKFLFVNQNFIQMLIKYFILTILLQQQAP